MKIKKLLIFSILNASLLFNSIFAAEPPTDDETIAITSTIEQADDLQSKDGPLAKIALLKGQLSAAPEKYHGTTLAHGAILWEFGIIKALYTILIEPKKITKDGAILRFPDEASTKEPLGRLLMQFFTLTARTLVPTKSISLLAPKLTPTHLGSLYACIMELAAAKEPKTSAGIMTSLKAIPLPQTGSGQTKNNFFSYIAACLLPSETYFPLDTNTLMPTVLLAYFWAVHIMQSPTQLEARQKLNEFNNAAGIIPTDSASVDKRLSDNEQNAIARLQLLYSQNLPKPPVQGGVWLADGRRFADCAESGLRGLCSAAFYNTASLRVDCFPPKPDDFYSIQIKEYFKTFNTLASQHSQDARNAWGAITVDHPSIRYNKDDLGRPLDMQSDVINFISMLAQLVPGSYRTLLEQCKISSPCRWATIGTEIDSVFYAQEHFRASPDCAKKMLEQFADDHGLVINNFTSADNLASWQVARNEPIKLCFLNFSTQSKHLDCELVLKKQDQYKVTEDRMLSSDNPNETSALLYAANSFANAQNFSIGYLALLSEIDTEALKNIQKRLNSWGILRPEDIVNIERYESNKTEALNAAASLNLAKTCKVLVEQGVPVDSTLPHQESPFLIAVKNGHLATVRQLYTSGANPNILNTNSKSGLMLAIENNYKDIVVFLCEEVLVNVNATSGYFPIAALDVAADHSNIPMMDYLLSRGADINNGDGRALMSAISTSNVTGIHTSISCVAFLCEKGALVQPAHLEKALFSIDLLIELCKHINLSTLTDEDKKKLLYRAICAKLTPAVEYLLNNGISGELCNQFVQSNNTLLIRAIEKDATEIVALLCAHGADPNFAAKEVFQFVEPATPLGQAIRQNNLAIVKILCKAGAKLRKSIYTRPYSELAELFEKHEIATYLRSLEKHDEDASSLRE